MKKRDSTGTVLISSILITLGIGLASAALLRIASEEASFAAYDERRAGAFGLAESCVDAALAWLVAESDPSEALPHAIEKTTEGLATGDESALERAKLAGYSSRCDVTGSPASGVPVALSGLSPSDEGEMAQDQGGYGLSGDLSPKVYYWAESTGEGGDRSKQRVSAIMSVRR
ncbi:MAG: hypothetical protein ABW189_00550 [Rickettsiales bacterium]